MKRSRTMRLVALFGMLVVTGGCDQATKHIARTQLGQLGSVTLPGSFFEFFLAENPGAFLSLGASLPQPARIVLTLGLTLGLLLMLVYLVRTTRLGLPPFLGLALVWAGGMSNLIDRFFRHGLVTDFMVIRVGPLQTGVFNLADLTIMVGIAILVFSMPARPPKSVVEGIEQSKEG
jgi:signal peptidase II